MTGSPTVLVTGGAGYVGSHVVLALREAGRPAAVLDDLSSGYGRGHTVREVLRAVECAAGRPVPVRMAPRRPGDPPALVARAARIREVLAWRPALDDLNLIVRSALAWERRMAAERGRNSLERV